MQNNVARVFQVFAAGAIGGLLQTLIIWISGQIGIFTILQLPLEFPLNPFWFYQRISWGGLWGLLFLLPLLAERPQLQRGALLGLVPALASLFIFLPFKNEQGFLGLDLGVMMPVVVVAFGLLWGVIAGWLLDRAQAAPQAAE